MTHKERRILIKTNAKERLKSNTSNPYLATLMLYGIMIGIVVLVILSIAIPMVMGAYLQSKSQNNSLGILLMMGGNISNNIANIAMQILFTILMIGFSWYTFKIYRGDENGYKNIFSGFSVRGFWTICARILASLFEGIFILAAALIVMVPLLIIIFMGTGRYMSDYHAFTIAFIAMLAMWILAIPAYIFAYGFRFINYIMYDDRKINSYRVLFKSWKMMKGHKWELFKLDLSLLGWQFITAITLGIAGIYSMPYIYTVYAGFYEEIKKEYTD